VAMAVGGDHRQVVGNGMAALNRDPGIKLARLLAGVILRVPADGRGVDQYLGAGQCHQSRRFRVPLVPAHQYSQAANAGLYRPERFRRAVAWGEVELFVETRIIRNMHLPVAAGQAAIGIQYHGGVVVDAAEAAFEHRADNHDIVLGGQFPEKTGGRARNRLCKVKTATSSVWQK